MKKRLFSFLLSLLLLLSACAESHGMSANEVMAKVRENIPLLMACVPEMESFLLERCYVAIEKPKAEEGQTLTDDAPVLMLYEKESDEREQIQSEPLERTLKEMGLALIFYQTASDSRRCVIFSYTKESAKGVQRGFYYSYDSLPCAWWGRKGDLEKEGNRYVQANRDGSAWYYTVEIGEGFFYFEKSGSLTA